MKKPSNLAIALPLIIASVLAIGLYFGQKLAPQQTTLLFSDTGLSQNDKLHQVMQYIESDYVDSVKQQKIIENTINEILQNLDPHSYYIPKKDYHAMNDPLEGNFEGIGIEFRIQEDTVMVVQPIGGGPSEKVGIQAGDRIIAVEGEDITGKEINNRKVIKLLKGPKGTEVNVSIKRNKQPELIDFAIQRDKIPLHSIDAAYMIDSQVGYIKILRFAKTTYDEFKQSVDKLKNRGMQKLVLDLRNNSGGFMQSAIKIADEFLPEDQLIVFTKGKARNRKDFYASSKGELEETSVTVLINEASASASEILAGALQDNDHGTIIGRRSFGKGLVQEGIQWPDGSAMRLTVARYYTPTGRSIQKSYENGLEEYNKEAFNRYQNGEMLSADSIDFPDSLKYITKGGKVLYGGGGIKPDIFVPLDTSQTSKFFGQLNFQGIFYQFAFQYVDKNRESLEKKYSEKTYFNDFRVSEKLLQDFFSFAEEKEIQLNEKEAERSSNLIDNRIKAYIGRNLWGDNLFYQIINQEDEVVKTARKILDKKA